MTRARQFTNSLLEILEMLDIKSFSESCRQVIILATEESRRLGHNFVASEQLLIGLLSADNGATQLLVAAGASLEDV